MMHRGIGLLGLGLAAITLAASFAACSSSSNGLPGTTSDASTEAAQGCPANVKECVSASLARVCPADGSGWLAVACSGNQTCDKGDCKAGPNPTTSCTAAQNTCTDATTALRCNDNGVGFASVKCPANTACTGAGLCQGACVVGSGTCGGSGAYVGLCADGNTVTQTPCAGTDLCVTVSGPGEAVVRTACKPAACVPGSCAVCGNKNDITADQTKFTSTCAPTPLGYNYVATECVAPQTCNPMGSGACGGSAACMSTCTPGATRCSPTSNGTQTCDATGKWSATVTACSTTQFCTSSGTTAICADPFCASGGVSSCDSAGNLHTCGADGKLGAGVACAAGACVASTANFNGTGIDKGSCQVQCQAGDERCTGAGATTYETCGANGLFNAPVACPSNAACFDFATTTGRPGKLCGGVCSPGKHRCTQDDGGVGGGPATSIETCDGTGTWGAAAACSVGTCQATSGSDAACVAQCVPNALVCTGGYKAGDGTFAGTAATGTCTAQGMNPTFPSCGGVTDGGGGCCMGNTTCRQSASGNAIGCVECVGTTVASGNERGQVDTRCSDTTGDAGSSAIESCQANNNWPAAPAACPGTTTCSTSATSCLSSCSVYTFVPFFHYIAISPCTQTAAVAAGSSCSNGQGGTNACGGTSDCCTFDCSSSSNNTAYCH